jgi:hypothetical protein
MVSGTSEHDLVIPQGRVRGSASGVRTGPGAKTCTASDGYWTDLTVMGPFHRSAVLVREKTSDYSLRRSLWKAGGSDHATNTRPFGLPAAIYTRMLRGWPTSSSSATKDRLTVAGVPRWLARWHLRMKRQVLAPYTTHDSSARGRTT